MSKDTIYREDAMALVNKPVCPTWNSDYDEGKENEREAIKESLIALPSADRPQGEWKHLKGDEWFCSNCGYVVWTEGSWEHPLERGKDYCEHCGARMKGADDEEL